MTEARRLDVLQAATPILLGCAVVVWVAGGAGIVSLTGLFTLRAWSWVWLLVIAALTLWVFFRKGALRAWVTAICVLAGVYVVWAGISGAMWMVSGAAIGVTTGVLFMNAGYLWGRILPSDAGITGAERLVLGLGVFGTLVFLLGVFGLFHPVIVWSVLVLSALGGAVIFLRGIHSKQGGPKAVAEASPSELSLQTSLLLGMAALLCAFVLICALLPHVHGAQDDYDVLEYHLQLPREYMEMGRVSVLRHNLFSALPQLVEMLYAPAMAVGRALSFVLPVGEKHIRYGEQVAAKSVNVVFLTLIAAMLLAEAKRRFGSKTSALWGMAAVFLPLWTVVLGGGGAMVEMGLAAFGLAGTLITLRGFANLFDGSEQVERRTLLGLAAGASAVGMAAATKYTGWLYFAVPLAAAAAVAALRKRDRRVFIVPACAGALFVLPWMAYAHFHTGNPFHPLFLRVFDERVLTTFTAERWRLSIEAQTGMLGAIARTYENMVGAWPGNLRLGPYGLVAVVLAVSLLISVLKNKLDMRRAGSEEEHSKAVGAWVNVTVALLMLWGLFAWLVSTNRLERFLYPIVVLSALAWSPVPGALNRLRTPSRCLWLPIGVMALSVPLTIHATIQERSIAGALRDANPGAYVRRINPSFSALERLNSIEGTVVLLGEAQAFCVRHPFIYATPYDRHPLADILLSEPMATLNIETALVKAGISAVYVDVTELERVARRYRPLENTPIPDISRATGDALLKHLAGSWRVLVDYEGLPGKKIILYVQPGTQAQERIEQ